MPEDAPLITTRKDPPLAKLAPPLSGGLLLLADLIDEIVDRLEHAFLRAGLLGAHGVAALDGHRRRAIDLVGKRELYRALGLALHAEGIERVVEFLLIDPLPLQPFVQGLGIVRAKPVAVDRVEEGP